MGEDGELTFRFPTDEVYPVDAEPIGVTPGDRCSAAERQEAIDQLLYFFYAAYSICPDASRQAVATKVGRMNYQLMYASIRACWDLELWPDFGVAPEHVIVGISKDTPLVFPGADVLARELMDDELVRAFEEELDDGALAAACWEPEVLDRATSAACRAALDTWRGNWVATHGADEKPYFARLDYEGYVEDVLELRVTKVAQPMALVQASGPLQEALDDLGAQVSGEKTVATFLTLLGQDFHVHGQRMTGGVAVSDQFRSVANESATLASADAYLAYTGDNPGTWASHDRSWRPGPFADWQGGHDTGATSSGTISCCCRPSIASSTTLSSGSSTRPRR